MNGFEPKDRDELRERLREMSDLELRRFGYTARKLSDPRMNFGSTDPYVVQLEEASELAQAPEAIVCISPLVRTAKLTDFESEITSGWLSCQNALERRKRSRSSGTLEARIERRSDGLTRGVSLTTRRKHVVPSFRLSEHPINT
jgi:hypothetical protein